MKTLILAFMVLFATQTYAQDFTAPELKGGWVSLEKSEGERIMLQFFGIRQYEITGQGLLSFFAEDEDGTPIRVSDHTFTYHVLTGRLNIDYRTITVYNPDGTVARRLTKPNSVRTGYEILEENNRTFLFLEGEEIGYMRLGN